MKTQLNLISEPNVSSGKQPARTVEPEMQPDLPAPRWTFQDAVANAEPCFEVESDGHRFGPLPLPMLREGVQQGYLTRADVVRPWEPSGDGAPRRLAEVLEAPGDFAVAAVETPSGLETAQEIVESLEKASSAMNEWAETATKMAKASRSLDDLNRLDQVMNGVTMFSRFSVALGLAGAAIGVATAVLGAIGKDSQAVMLEMLGKLFDSVEALRTQMLSRFEALSAHVDVNTAKAQIDPYVNTLDSATKQLAAYREAIAQGRPPEVVANLGAGLRECRRTDLYNAANGIYRHCVTESQGTALSIFQTLYQESFGDYALITDVGAALLTYMANAAILDATVCGLELRDQLGRDPVPEDLKGIGEAVDRLYSPLTRSVHDAFAHWTSLCESQASQNIQKHLEQQILPNTMVKDYRLAAQAILGQLQSHHGWCDFHVIVYSPRRGYDHHRYIASTGFLPYLSHNFPGGDKANVVLAWIPRRTGETAPVTMNVPEVGSWCRSVTGLGMLKGVDPVWGPRLAQWVATRLYGNAQEALTQYPKTVVDLFHAYHQLPGLFVFASSGISELHDARSDPNKVAIISIGKFCASVFADTRSGLGRGVKAFTVVKRGSSQTDCFTRRMDDSLARRSFNGRWGRWENLGGALLGTPAVVSRGPDRLDCFSLAADRGLCYRAWDGERWVGWKSLGGSLLDSPAVVARGPDRLDVFSRNADGALWQRAWDGERWLAWERLGGSLLSAPTAVSWGHNRVDVFSINADHALWRRAWDGERWLDWECLGGSLLSGPAAVSWGPNRLDVFSRNADNALWHRGFDGTRWSEWQSLGGVLLSSPAAVSRGAGLLDVFSCNADHAIWHRALADGQWQDWNTIGGHVTGAPAVVSGGSDHLDVFITAVDNEVWHNVRKGESWQGWVSLG